MILEPFSFCLSVDIFFVCIFKSWITISVIIRGKRNLPDFRVFDLAYRAKSKTQKSRKFLVFLLNHMGTFQFFAQLIKKLLDTLKLSDITPVFEKLDTSTEANYRTVSILPLVSKKFEKIMCNKLYEYIETFLSQLLCGILKAIYPIPTFTKTVKRAWLRGVYWYNFNELIKRLWLLASLFINGKIRSIWS